MTADRREQWLAERRTGIGGSDVAAILGLSPWATPLTVWLDKTGRSPQKEETLAMRIGTRLEDFVAELYCEETGRKVQRYTKMIHRGCLLGNFDRLVIREGEKVASHMGEVRTDTLLECKTGTRPWDDGEVPIYYQTQVQHYMGLEPALKQAHIAYLNLTYRQFSVYTIPRHDGVIAELQGRMSEWWERHIVRGEIPKPSTEADCKLLWQTSNPGKRVEATAEILEAVERLRSVRTAYDEIKGEKESLEAAVKGAMGNAETLVGWNGFPLATWKSGRDMEVIDWKGIVAELDPPKELVSRHTSTKPGKRTFLLKAV